MMPVLVDGIGDSAEDPLGAPLMGEEPMGLVRRLTSRTSRSSRLVVRTFFHSPLGKE